MATASTVGALDAIPLAQLVAALSGALDLTEGSLVGHSARTCYIAMRLAERIRLPDDERSDLYYAALLKDAGCSSNAARLSALFGNDDHALKEAWRLLDWTNLRALFRYLRRGVAPSAPVERRVRRLFSLCVTGGRDSRALQRTRCERGASIVRKMGFPSAVSVAVFALDEHWDGNGIVERRRGDNIPLLARILCLAQTAEVFFAAGGLPSMLHVIRARRRRWFDPHLVDALVACARDQEFVADLARPAVVPLVTAREPGKALPVDDARLDAIAEAFAEVVDAKSPFTGRHSTNVAAIAVAAARAAGADAAGQQALYRAGLLHDLGKLGVPNTILDKPGRPTPEEWAVLREHPAGTARILAPIPALANVAAIAVAHHERMDGQGYHRGIPAGALPFPARILAAADVYEALVADRPYRAGLPPSEAAAIMTKMAGDHLDPVAARLVAAIGMPEPQHVRRSPAA